jgi:2-C-methyl-D-erythritol 4-phosphate cytidylyltransferase/2-C-methyl-D-erythritol 2,4-cyclodiphosphate synthase
MPAAGHGRRMGAVDGLAKQYLPLAGRTVIEHALAPFLADPACLGAIVALAAGDATFATLAVAREPRVSTVTGGRERRDSVAAGLAALAARVDDDPWVLVHDAARPCLPAADLDALLEALREAPHGALLAMPVVDTIKRGGGDGAVDGTVPRAGLWRAQTPQAFRLRRLAEALERAPAATDESSAIEALGDRPRLVAGSPDNLKITAPADLAPAARQLGGRPSMTLQRIGFGTDVHAFGPGDHVWLGGVRIPHDQGLVAHSDGDVLLHALCDALLGAAGLGDIGQHFPDSDPRWKGVASIGFLRHVLGLLRDRGLAPVNVDLTLLGEAPRLSPHREAIRTLLAGELKLAAECVNVKATTTERLGFTGRREGLAAQVVALVGPAS